MYKDTKKHNVTDAVLKNANKMLSELQELIVEAFDYSEYDSINLIFGGEWFERAEMKPSKKRQKLLISNCIILYEFKIDARELFFKYGFDMLIDNTDEWFLDGETEMGDIMDTVRVNVRAQLGI